MSEKVFVKLLHEFLDCVIEARPGNKGAVEAKANLALIPESLYSMVVDNWYAWSSPVLEGVRQKDAQVVGSALDNCGVSLISQIGARDILCDPKLDPETREAFWRFLTSLTALSGMIKKGDASAFSAMAAVNAATAPVAAAAPAVTAPLESSPVAAAPVAAAPVAAAAPAATAPVATAPPVQGQPKVDVMQGIAKAIPEIFKGLNDILKNQSDDNPLGQIMRQMLNPDQVQTGAFNNVAANLMQRTDPSVIGSVSAQTGLDSEEIMRKLKRLETLERARQKKKSSRG